MIGFATISSLFFVVAGVLTFRLGLLPFGISFYTFGFGLIACFFLALMSGALVFKRLAGGQALEALPLYLLACLLPVALVVYRVGLAGFQVPPIHDITTDRVNPPAFVFAQAERKPGENSLVYGGEVLSEQQRLAYAHLAPLLLAATTEEVWIAALSVVRASGWRLLGEDKTRGHIEAADTTPLMAFTDDVLIRIRPVESDPEAVAPAGVVVDVRSVSRLGMSDLGANAKRIDVFLQNLQSELAKN